MQPTWLLYLTFWLLITRQTHNCKISIRDDLGNHSPLLLNKRNEFIYPTASHLEFEEDKSFQIACPGSNIQVNGNDITQSEIEVRCAGKFKIVDREIAFNQITCRKPPQSIIEFTDEKCGPRNKYDKFQIGFVVKSGFLPQIEGCYDKERKNTLYTVHIIPRGISFSQISERVSFKDATCKLGKESSNKLYQKERQKNTINKLLNLPANSSDYIQNSQYLAKGHLTPTVDFVYNSQQRATFFCNNAVPQWQNNNNGNWKKVEYHIRDLASKSTDGLMVYTGTSGISKLQNVPLYLFAQDDVNGFPVPEFVWKVVRNPKESTAMAFIVWNNPFVDMKTSPCESICEQINFRISDINNLEKGQIVCCSVNSALRKKIVNIPNF